MNRSWLPIAFTLAVLVFTVPATALASLEAAVPAQDIPDRPSQDIVLTFPNEVEAVGMVIELRDANSEVIPIEEPELSANRTDVTVPLKEPLSPGIYTVRWKALSIGGRKSRGSYIFRVAP